MSHDQIRGRRLSQIPVFEIEVTPDPIDAICTVQVTAPIAFTLSQGARQMAADCYEGSWQVRGFLADRQEAVTISTDRLFVEVRVPRSRVYDLPPGAR